MSNAFENARKNIQEQKREKEQQEREEQQEKLAFEKSCVEQVKEKLLPAIASALSSYKFSQDPNTIIISTDIEKASWEIERILSGIGISYKLKNNVKSYSIEDDRDGPQPIKVKYVFILDGLEINPDNSLSEETIKDYQSQIDKSYNKISSDRNHICGRITNRDGIYTYLERMCRGRITVDINARDLYPGRYNSEFKEFTLSIPDWVWTISWIGFVCACFSYFLFGNYHF